MAERLSHGRAHGESQAEMAPGHPGLGAADAPHHLPTTSPPPRPCRQAAGGHVPGAFLPDQLQLQTETWDQPPAVRLLGTARESVTAGFSSLNPPAIVLLSLGLPQHEKHPAAGSTSIPRGTRDDPEASEDS